MEKALQNILEAYEALKASNGWTATINRDASDDTCGA